jgi:predicted hydrocarbon binding protein
VSPETASALISNRLLKQFVSAAFEEVGVGKLPQVLAEANLTPAVMEAESIRHLGGRGSAETYAVLQQALRLFYGRGARGILIRIGSHIWERMVTEASFLEKAELEILRRLPVPARRRRTLNFAADHLSPEGSSVTVHLLDTDLLLVDHSSATTSGQKSAEPICFVTLGLLEAALHWATGQEADIEEIACRAAGSPACEFKVRLGGR